MGFGRMVVCVVIGCAAAMMRYKAIESQYDLALGIFLGNDNHDPIVSSVISVAKQTSGTPADAISGCGESIKVQTK